MGGTSQKLASYYSTAAAVLQAINALVLQLATHSPSRDDPQDHSLQPISKCSEPTAGSTPSLCIKRGKVSVRMYVCIAGRGANDVIMRIAGLVPAEDMAIGDMWPRVAMI